MSEYNLRPVSRLSLWRDLNEVEFNTRYENEPVVLEGFSTSWPAFTKWTKSHFRTNYGGEMVGVVATHLLNGKPHPWMSTVPMAEFLDALDAGETVYLREWYGFKAHPELYDDVSLQPPLSEDWLDAIPRGWMFDRDTRSTFYWGAANTSTPCHFDNLDAITWNTVLYGTKRWTLFSGRELIQSLGGDEPQATLELTKAGILDREGNLTREGIDNARSAFPSLTFFTTDIGAGDAIFVPRKWLHQVTNLTECLAIGRYYMASSNYEAMRSYVRNHYGRIPAAVLSTFTRKRQVPGLRHIARSRSLRGLFQALMRMRGHSEHFFDGR